MKITPLYDRILVEIINSEQKSAGGIILTKDQNQKSLTGKVRAVGEGHVDKKTNVVTPLKVQVGDIVLFSKYATTEITSCHCQSELNLVVMREEDVLAIVVEE